VAQNDNPAKDFARKYGLSSRDMAALFGVSPSLASRWLSETEVAILTTATILSIENMDRVFEILRMADALKLKLSPSQLQIFEDWLERSD
jgi:predicted transcriptional regulator